MTRRWATLLITALATVTLSWADVQARPGSDPLLEFAAGDPVSPAAKAVLDGLGSLAGGITLGKANAWTASVEDARFVLRNDTNDDAVRLYTANWTGDRVVGRSISIRVELEGPPRGGDGSTAGLAFRSDDEVDTYLAWAMKSDGQVALYRRDPASGLSMLSAYDVPGGHRAAGDLLAVSERGDAIGLYVNGRLVAAVPADKVVAVGKQDRIGILAVGEGRMTFRTFTVGPPIPGSPAPSGPQKTADTVPPSDAPQAQGVASLGPLASEVTLGHAGPWTARGDGGRLVLSNADSAGAVRYYSTQWQGDLAAGRSVGVKVKVTGSGPLSAAGLILRISDGDPRWLAVVVTSDGMIAAYRRNANALNLVVKTAIPGGHRADGDLLQINQTGDSGQVFVNGQAVTEIPRDVGEKSGNPLPVGVVALGTGEFTFGDFAFGPLVKPLVGDDTVPVPGPQAGGDDTVPVPQAGGDDTVPVPKPPVTPPSPSEQTSGTADIPGMGPLGKAVTLGRDATWTKSVQDGQLVFANDTDGDATYTRTIGWGDIPPAGRSAGVRVTQQGASGASRGGGLTFGYGDKGARYLAFIVTAEGKAALFNIKDGSIDPVASIDLPGGQTGTHLMQISRTGTRTKLFADGRLVTTLSPDDGRGLDLSGDVGVVAVGTGRFAFDGFAFGPPVAAAAEPPKPERHADTVDVPGMGPLGIGVSIGRDAAWRRSVDGGKLVFANDTDENGTYTRTHPWEGTSAGGRSVEVRVAVSGAPDAGGGGGLVFGYADRGARYLAFLATLDGRAALYQIKAGSLSFVNSIDLPGPPAGDHLMQVSQTGDRTALYADGRLVTTLSHDDGRGLDLSGDVGVIGVDKGRFAFDAFSFGPAVVSAPGTGVSPPGPTPFAAKADPLATQVFGATLGILVHEFGHYAIGELKIPATGPEEDVADELAAMDFVDGVRVDPTVVAPMALGFAKFWQYSALDRGEEGQPRWYDEHAPDMQRFAKIMCILYGGDPKIFQAFVDDADIPERSQQRCLNDQPKLHRAWETLLRSHRRRDVDALEPGDLDSDTPGHKVTVEYQDPKDPAMRPIAEALKRGRTFDMFADAVTKLYVIPRDTRIVFRDCDKENCFYNPFDGSVTMCWEMISFVIQDFKKHQRADGSASRTP